MYCTKCQKCGHSENNCWNKPKIEIRRVGGKLRTYSTKPTVVRRDTAKKEKKRDTSYKREEDNTSKKDLTPKQILRSELLAVETLQLKNLLLKGLSVLN